MALGARLVERPGESRRSGGLEPRAFVATVARSMAMELDMRLEAAAASRLAEVMARDAYMAARLRWCGLAWASGC